MNIELKNIEKKYLGNKGIKKINLSIESGELIVVMGSSGCGKTTLLRCVAGLEKADSGEIIFEENGGQKHNLEKKMGFFFQDYALYPNMNVYENISFGLKINNYKDIDQRVNLIADSLEIKDILNKPVQKISGGQKQRTALARAIARDISLLLLDEPLSNLDGPLREEIKVTIKKIVKQNKLTCLYVTHDYQEALYIADRMIIMDKGSVIQSGCPKDIYDNPYNLYVLQFTTYNKLNKFRTKFTVKDNIINFVDINLSSNISDRISEKIKANNELIVGMKYSDIEIYKNNPNGDRIEAKLINKEYLGNLSRYNLKVDKSTIVVEFKDIDIVDDKCFIEIKKCFYFNVVSELNILNEDY